MPREDISTHSLQSHGDLGQPASGTNLSSADNLWIQRAKQLTEQLSARKSTSTVPFEPPHDSASEDTSPRQSFYSQGRNSVSNPMQSGTVVNSWLVNNTLKGNTRQSVRDDMLIKSHAIKVSVADCFCVRVQDELKLLYKIAIYDRNNEICEDMNFAGVQIISKRHDEMLYLRDRIAADYPHSPFPPLPAPLPTDVIFSLIAESTPTPGADNHMVKLPKSTTKGGSSVVPSESTAELSRHTELMNALLECLISHPQAGQQVLASLRNNYEAELLADTVSQSFKDKTMLLHQEIDDGGVTGGGGGPVGHHTEFPLLIDSYAAVLAKAAGGSSSSQKSLRARVFGWTDVLTTSTVSRKYRLMRKSAETTIVHFDFEVVYNNTIWICRKRYCQFRALLNAVKRLYAEGIGEELRISHNDFNFPCIEDELSEANLVSMKEVLGENLFSGAAAGANQGITSLTEHQENMLTELTMSLDCFIKTLMEIHEPLPPVLMAFLETDTLKVKGKYDIVAMADGPGWDVVKADDANFALRREYSDLIKNKFNQTSFRSAAEDRGSMKLSAENAAGNLSNGASNNYYFMTAATVIPCLNESGIPDMTIAPEVPTVTKLGGGGIGGFSEGMSVSARSGQCDSQFNGSEVDDSQQDGDVESGRGSMGQSLSSRHGDVLAGVAIEGAEARPISLSANRHDVVRSSTPVERKTLHQRATDMLGGGKPAVSSRPALSVREMLMLPGEVLEELSSLLTFLRSNDITAYKANESCRGVRGDCVDFITLKELLCLDMSAASLVSELDEEPDSVVSSDGAWVSVNIPKASMECGAWVSQYRIRNAILGTTAFQDICRKVERLQTIDLEELERKQHLPPAQNVNHYMITSDEKYVFWINMYNLLALHASIMLPWPAAAQTSIRASTAASSSMALIGAVAPIQTCLMQRTLWQVHAKYRIGKQSLSLFQLEHGILRALTPHNVFITSLVNNNSASVVGSWLPCAMPNVDVSIPSIADVKAFAPLIPTLYQNTIAAQCDGAATSNGGSLGLGSGDPRVSFMLRLPHHTSISWSNVAVQSSRSQKRTGNNFHGVLNQSNIKAALRQMTTLYLSQQVRFTSAMGEGDDCGAAAAIVLPYLLHKYAGDFAKWKMVYDTPFTLLSHIQSAAVKAPKSPSRAPVAQTSNGNLSPRSSSLSRSLKSANSLSTSNTQWDVVEFQQRTSAGNSVAKTSSLTEAPYSGLSIQNDRAESSEIHAAMTEGLGQGSGLWAERELFRICRLLASHLEIKDRKYILKVYKDAFLGRCVPFPSLPFLSPMFVLFLTFSDHDAAFCLCLCLCLCVDMLLLC